MNTSTNAVFGSLLSALRGRWAALATRERWLVAAAASVVGVALVWWVGVRPALETLRSAEAQHRSLDAQLQSMGALAAEAQRLQALPRLSTDDALKALDLSVKQHFGATAQLSVVGERATVTLKGASASALATWLAAARSNARAVPVDARLAQNAARTGWDGSIVLALAAP